MIAISILLVAVTAYSDSKWKKQYAQWMQEENYDAARELLAEHSKTSVYKETVNFYLDLWEKSGDYSGAEAIVEKYYESLGEPANFNKEIEERLQNAEADFTPEQREKIHAVLERVSEARAVKESQKASKAQDESKQAAEKEAQNASKAQEEAKKAEEKQQTEKKEAQTRIDEAIERCMKKSDSKTLEQLQKENEEWVKSALLQKINEAVQTSEQTDDWLDDVENYCELYRNLYGGDGNRKIEDAVQKLKSLETQKDTLGKIKVAGKQFNLEDAYNMSTVNDLYVTQRLEIKYDDTISGAIKKEADNFNQPKGSEWVAYNVRYEAYGQYPGDDAVVICASSKNPFPKEGVYSIYYIASSETRDLRDSKGFVRTVPVYYMLENGADLYERQSQYEALKTEIFHETNHMRELMGIPQIQSSAENTNSYGYEALDFAGRYEGSGYTIEFSAGTDVYSDEIGDVSIYYGNTCEGENLPVYLCTSAGDWNISDYEAVYEIRGNGDVEYMMFYRKDGTIYMDYNSPFRNNGILELKEHYES